MIKQMLKIANLPNEKALLQKYPTEADFLREYGAEMLYMYGGSYADGGMAPDQQGMQQGPPPGAEQGQPQQGGGQEEQVQQIVQFIGQALQQGMKPEEILQKLVEAGLPQDQAQQLIQAVMQQMQGGDAPQEGGMPPQGGQEGMMESPQGQEAPPQEMMEGQAPMGMYGGSYGYGGATHNNSTYSAGMSYANGGPFIPEYGDIAWNVDYATGGEAGTGNELMVQVAQLLQQGVQPQAILQQLVQAKIPQKKAVKLIQMVMEKLQAAGGGAGQQQASAPQEQAMMAFGGPTYSKVTQYNHQGIVPALDWMGYGGIPVTQTTTKYPREEALEEARNTYENNMKLYQMNKEMPNYSMDPNTGAMRMLPTKIDMPNFRFGDLSNPQVMSIMTARQAEARKRAIMEEMQQRAIMQERAKQRSYVDPTTGKQIPQNKRGGSTQYKKGGEYEMTHDDVQDLINKGYKIQYL